MTDYIEWESWIRPCRAAIMYQTLHSLVANEPPATNQLQGGDTDRVQDPDLWYHRLQGIVVLFYTTARIWN